MLKVEEERRTPRGRLPSPSAMVRNFLYAAGRRKRGRRKWPLAALKDGNYLSFLPKRGSFPLFSVDRNPISEDLKLLRRLRLPKEEEERIDGAASFFPCPAPPPRLPNEQLDPAFRLPKKLFRVGPYVTF